MLAYVEVFLIGRRLKFERRAAQHRSGNIDQKADGDRPHQRLDIQGLRMVAIMLVFATHLCGWPNGGFIGVDVFFVISGFLITGNLLRMAEKRGNVSFKEFYLNRLWRIVPAATLVLVLTYGFSLVVFQQFRADQIGVDALFAFIFMANWWFAARDTNYFAIGDTVSPIQHYWSLSIEEQFYFVWPGLIFLIGLAAASRPSRDANRVRVAGWVMSGGIALSLGWAIYQSSVATAWAYFDTFSRAWELGVGALLAAGVGAFVKLPKGVRPWISWAGIGLIAVSALLITERSVGFPAPWALLPVAGSALVIIAGVGQEPDHQPFLRNRVSVYIGNISYSLYLFHWPLIVIIGSLVAPASLGFYFGVVALAFGLAIASYHFVENPLRYTSRANLRKTVRKSFKSSGFSISETTRYAGMAAISLVVAGIASLTLSAFGGHTLPPEVGAADFRPQTSYTNGADVERSKLGPLGTTLQNEIVEALKATTWPALTPPLEEAVALDSPWAEPGVYCPDAIENPEGCSWGPPNAPVRAVILGDSIAMGYAGPLREIATSPESNLRLYSLAMVACTFVADLIQTKGLSVDECTRRKQDAVDFINATQPDVVFIANRFRGIPVVGSDEPMRPEDWQRSLSQYVEKFRTGAKKIVFLSPPAGDLNIKNCISKKSATPADCIGKVGAEWLEQADIEKALASTLSGTWIDSRPWLCHSNFDNTFCPSFAGVTPTRRDQLHITPAYGHKIFPVINESLTDTGVLR